MTDGWSTTNLFLASTVHMVYGAESLTGIEMRPVPNSRNMPEYKFDIGSCDGEILNSEYEAGTLAITSVKAFAASYVRITAQLKVMHQRNQTSWMSPAWQRQWIAGKRDDGRRIE